MEYENIMTFDSDVERYVLTLSHVKQELEIPFRDDGVTERRLKKNSRIVYQYIYSHSFSANSKIIKYLINNTASGKRFIYDLLFTQFEADCESGYNDIGIQPYIDAKSKQAIEHDKIEENMLSAQTLQIIESCSTYFNGLNIMCKCAYPRSVYLRFMENKL